MRRPSIYTSAASPLPPRRLKFSHRYCRRRSRARDLPVHLQAQGSKSATARVFHMVRQAAIDGFERAVHWHRSLRESAWLDSGEVHGAGSPGAAPLARGTTQRPGPSPGRARASHTLRAFRSASYRHVWPTTKNTGHACGGRSCCAVDRAPVVLGSRCMIRNQGAGRTSVIKWH